MRRLWSAGLALALALAAPAQGGLGLFKKSNPNPAEAAAPMLRALRSEQDEKKRAEIPAKLAEIDPKAAPEVVPGLTETLGNDPAAAVREAAANALPRFRPASPEVGFALETAAQTDPSPRVRSAARAALWQYSLLGYKPNLGDGRLAQSAEPPLAGRPTPYAPDLAPAPAEATPVGLIPKRESKVPPAPKIDPAPVAAAPPPSKPVFPRLAHLFGSDRPEATPVSRPAAMPSMVAVPPGRAVAVPRAGSAIDQSVEPPLAAMPKAVVPGPVVPAMPPKPAADPFRLPPPILPPILETEPVPAPTILPPIEGPALPKR